MMHLLFRNSYFSLSLIFCSSCIAFFAHLRCLSSSSSLSGRVIGGMTSWSHVLRGASLWKQHARYAPSNVVREWWGTVLPTEGGAGGKLSVPSQANNNKPGAGFQWAFSLKWDTATRITNISLVLSSGPGPWKNYSKYLPRFIWNPGIG